MTARLALWFFIHLALGWVCLPVAAQNLIAERAIFEDPHGTLTLEQAQHAEFSVARKIISQGYTPAVLWVRLRVDAPPAAQRLRLRVFPAQLEKVTLFSALLPHEGQPLTERTAWIDTRPGPNTYYLRIQTSGPMLLQPLVLSAAQAQQDDSTRGFILGVVLACYVPLLVWLLVLITTRRQVLHLAFLLNFSVVVASFLGWMGYLSEFFGPAHWASSSTAIFLLGMVNIFTGFLCVCLVLHRFGLPRWGQQLFTLLGTVYVTLFVLFFVLDRQLVIQCSSILGLVASVFALPLTVAVFYRQKLSTWLIGALMCFAMVLGLRWFLTLHALVPAVESLVSLLFFRLIFAVGFVAATLWLIDREKQNQLQMSITNEAVARKLAESETLRRQTQERFMTMLMHELKTPLAIIQLAATSLGRHLSPDSGDATRVKNINRAVDDLNALVERCASADQIDQGAMQMHKESLCLETLAADVLQTLGSDRITLSAPAQHMVFSDAQYLRLILLNLLSNALKYSPPDSPVTLQFDKTTGPHVAGVSVRVSNAVGAAGMPDPAQVFSRYYRAEGARRQVGAGLGLWLAQALARQLGSELQFNAGHGRLSFSFFLELA
ncbi:MAG: 7TM-DISM domain-containing protein [Rhodoferax sp.]|nr:7TM-DISM domain-containing protein [Rhodoferax sp.]MDP3654119.1 7TM-DISM domain-containing protein [Rhodoferax sp.]